MTIQDMRYAPRPLMMVREYPGYQFYAELRLDAHSADDCFRYAALTVQNWLCERIQKAEGVLPDVIACPAPKEYMRIPTSALHSCKLPFSEIISLPEQGVWTLSIRESAPNIAGRSFVTHVGLREIDDKVVQMGIRIDVLDGHISLPEQDVVYRPQFVRLLFETEGMTVSQVKPLSFRCYTRVLDRRAVARLKDLADDRENMLPLVIFTYVAERTPDVAEMQKMIEDMMRMKPMPGFGDSKFSLPSAPAKRESTYILPYDAQEFSRHTYGFARPYVVSPSAFGELRAKFGKVQLNGGDILCVEPKAFGGATWVIRYAEGMNASWYREATDGLLEKLKRYSKHKPFSFGDVLFIEDARQLLRGLELESMRASIHTEQSDEIQKLFRQLERERETSEEQALQIRELRNQMGEEYRRGEANERQRAQAVEAQLDAARAEIADLKRKNEAMYRSYAELSALREIAGSVQSVRSMPQSNDDVVSYFKLMFADRIAFTDRGAKTAAKCDIKPEVIWNCLFDVATVLVDLYRNGVQNVEKRFKEATGWELAPTEGAMTRKVAEYMNLRRDIYEGREISIEPHVKFSKSLKKTGAQYQRLHYAYDPVSAKIVIGYIGDHLENYMSLSAH